VAALYAAGAGAFHSFTDASVYDLTDLNTVESATGKSGNAARFVRGNNEGLTANSYAPPFDEWTLACWARQVELSPDRYFRMISIGSGYCNLYLYVTNLTGRIGLIQSWNADDAGWSGPSWNGWGNFGDATQWHHYAVTYSKSSGVAWVYFDGVRGAASTVANGVTGSIGSQEIRVGHNGGGTDSCGGDVDETLVLARAYSADDIAALYAAGAGRFYDFNTL
jgi:hypothetical protein